MTTQRATQLFDTRNASSTHPIGQARRGEKITEVAFEKNESGLT
jgi:hypothetical protein